LIGAWRPAPGLIEEAIKLLRARLKANGINGVPEPI
jgi:hypothetical protein